MLQSLEINNYRSLKDMKIFSLGRINLVTGKNNTGKSTLLEAISIYASKCDLVWITQLLEERGENYRPSLSSLNSVEANVKTFSSLFSDRIVEFFEGNPISIGTMEETLSGKNISIENSVSIRFIKYYDEIIGVNEGSIDASTRRKRIIIQEESLKNGIDLHVGLDIRNGHFSYILPLDEERPLRYKGYRNISAKVSFQLIRTYNINSEINGKLWDAVTLTEKEGFIIEALRIIEPEIDRIAFIEENARERNAVVKLKKDSYVVPLKSMGDGINRVFTIILALVNADNGYLLIDEFENGLHYSVQEKLWEIIFKLAQRLNIQVFATTHSEDCIKGFEVVLNSNQNESEGKLIRLDNFNGKIKQTEFDACELMTAVKHAIETR